MSNLPAIKSFAQSGQMLAKIEKSVQDSEVFMNSVLTLCQNNDYLAKCTPVSIWGSAIQSALMGLSLSPAVSHGYIVPYGKEAKFMPSYKGYIQLAIDTGKYRSINATPVYQDEVKGYNPLTSEFTFKEGFSLDSERFSGGAPVGYYACFELKDGFTASVFMTREQMEDYATKYSQAYKRDKQYKKQNSPWSTEFDAMAQKTVLKQLITKYGPINQKLEMALTAESEADAYENAQTSSPVSQPTGQHIGTQEAEAVPADEPIQDQGNMFDDSPIGTGNEPSVEDLYG